MLPLLVHLSGYAALGSSAHFHRCLTTTHPIVQPLVRGDFPPCQTPAHVYTTLESHPLRRFGPISTETLGPLFTIITLLPLPLTQNLRSLHISPTTTQSIYPHAFPAPIPPISLPIVPYCQNDRFHHPNLSQAQ